VRNVRKGDNCWDGKSNRDDDEGVLPTLGTGCETREGPFASGQKHCDSEKRRTAEREEREERQQLLGREVDQGQRRRRTSDTPSRPQRIAHTGDMEQCIEVEETKYCNMAYVIEDKAEPSCQGAIWRSEWPEATQRCPIRTVQATATVWALEKDEFWVVLPNTT
jgi:hypothetical protein